eukprot:1179028-Rhodomonas_salina.1
MGMSPTLRCPDPTLTSSYTYATRARYLSPVLTSSEAPPRKRMRSEGLSSTRTSASTRCPMCTLP